MTRQEQFNAFKKERPGYPDEVLRVEFAEKFGLELEDGRIAKFNQKTGRWEHLQDGKVLCVCL